MQNFTLRIAALLLLLISFSCHFKDKVDLSSIEGINAVLKENPKDTAALFARARFFVGQNKPDSAIIDLQQLVAIDSTRSAYFVLMADVYLITNRTRYTKQALEKAVKLDPNNVEAHMKLAELYLYVEMRQEALNEINAALRLDQKFPKAYFLKGVIYKEIGDTSLAFSSFMTTVEQDANNGAAYEQIGLLFADRGDKRAVDYYQNALRINPKNSLTRYNLGIFYQEQGAFESAMEVYKELVNIDPNYSNAYYNMGYIIYTQNKSLEKALEFFQKATITNPGYAEAFYMRGLCQEDLGKKDLAITDYKESIRLNPKFDLPKNALIRLGASL
jgi:tetratricopeptide (TPR) repeat protein